MERFGKLQRIKLVHKSNCAFVHFTARDAAENAIKTLHDRFFIGDKKLKVLWAKA